MLGIQSKKAKNTVAAYAANTVVGVLTLIFGDKITPELRDLLLIIVAAGYVFISGHYNIGQGIADKGKEAAKITAKLLLIFMLSIGLILMPAMTWAQPADTEEAPISVELEQCKGDYEACMVLLNECDGADCPVIACPDCEKICNDKCGWVALVKDKTFMAAVLGGAVFLFGGIAGMFLTPQ